MIANDNLKFENAPRDQAALKGLGMYRLRLLAQNLGMLNDQKQKLSFINGDIDLMSKTVADYLKVLDSAKGTNGATHAQPPSAALHIPAAVSQTPAPPLTQGPTQLAIPGTGASTEATAPATKPRREPKTSNDGDVVAALKSLKEAIDNNTAAINTLATAVTNQRSFLETTAGGVEETNGKLDNLAGMVGSIGVSATYGTTATMLACQALLQDSIPNLVQAVKDQSEEVVSAFSASGN